VSELQPFATQKVIRNTSAYLSVFNCWLGYEQANFNCYTKLLNADRNFSSKGGLGGEIHNYSLPWTPKQLLAGYLAMTIPIMENSHN
jgi:hypothetical protein